MALRWRAWFGEDLGNDAVGRESHFFVAGDCGAVVAGDVKADVSAAGLVEFFDQKADASLAESLAAELGGGHDIGQYGDAFGGRVGGRAGHGRQAAIAIPGRVHPGLQMRAFEEVLRIVLVEAQQRLNRVGWRQQAQFQSRRRGLGAVLFQAHDGHWLFGKESKVG